MCPITGQADLYKATITYEPDALCIESKSLKLYLAHFRNEGAFCEALALTGEHVHVKLEQKARGGITITASV